MALPLAPKPRSSLFKRRQTQAGLLFILPWLISLLVFTLYPVFGTLALSFTEYNIIKPPEFIGLDNFREMFFHDIECQHADHRSMFAVADM